MMHDIWIDVQTGTWGRLDGMVIVHCVTTKEIDQLNNASDAEISQFGRMFGTRLMAHPLSETCHVD
jgi:hypothetical protein